MEMLSQALPALYALAGALVGALASFAGILVTQHHETKRALRHELFASATAYWNKKIELAQRTGGYAAPLEDHIVDFMALSPLLLKGEALSDEEVIRLLQRREARWQRIIEFRIACEGQAQHAADHERISSPK